MGDVIASSMVDAMALSIVDSMESFIVHAIASSIVGVYGAVHEGRHGQPALDDAFRGTCHGYPLNIPWTCTMGATVEPLRRPSCIIIGAKDGGRRHGLAQYHGMLHGTYNGPMDYAMEHPMEESSPMGMVHGIVHGRP